MRARFPLEQEERGTLPLPTSREDAEDIEDFAGDEPGILEITGDSFYEWGTGRRYSKSPSYGTSSILKARSQDHFVPKSNRVSLVTQLLQIMPDMQLTYMTRRVNTC